MRLLGPFLLTHLLLNLLSKSDNGRVINLSAVAHLRAKIDVDDLNSEKKFVEIEAFSQSKLALTMFTKHMASLLKRTFFIFNKRCLISSFQTQILHLMLLILDL